MKHSFTFTLSLLAIITMVATPRIGQSHCQVPCGIYDDNARVQAMLEDAATVVKATAQMAALVGKETDAQTSNQLIRWVFNKETHAQKVIATISDYFLTQRVKTSQDDYVERLKKHHAIILAAMKAKQSSDPAAAEALVEAIKGIAGYYPAK